MIIPHIAKVIMVKRYAQGECSQSILFTSNSYSSRTTTSKESPGDRYIYLSSGNGGDALLLYAQVNKENREPIARTIQTRTI